ILITEVWQTIDSFQDPELRRLAKALPETVLKARADSTTKKYLRAFARWANWAAGKSELTVFPVEVPQFALFLQHLGESTKSRAAVEEAVNAISWVQRLAGQEEILSSNGLIKVVVEGFQRQLARPKKRKEPVTIHMLQEIVASIDLESLSGVRLATICLLAFAAFLRYDEISKLRCCDIKITGGKMEVKLSPFGHYTGDEGNWTTLLFLPTSHYLHYGYARQDVGIRWFQGILDFLLRET
uniref:Core-binding (CB) domain-containing protein n=1 Tax=Amphimedon queenslandica TaxID=400682 RepID=A0A1X7SJI6_AMPQE